MRGYRWPGNVRELVNVLERAAVLSEGGELRVHLPSQRGEASAAAGLATLREVERAHLRRVLQATGGKLYGPGGAAEVLGLKPSTLQSRMSKLGVSRVQPRLEDGDPGAR
jgi:transcriptional regulator of acetoin/glycerol metabolism